MLRKKRKRTMKLRSYLLSDENIYLAIYAVRSYVFDPQLLDSDDKKLLNDLMDPFDEETIFEVITDVKGIIKHILDEDDYLFKTQVYFKPKEYQNGECIYRPIHTAKLDQLIAMVAIMHPLIYEIATRDEEWKLNLSNYSRLIPKNFYGNRVSKKPEDLFKKWNYQYKKFTQKANEYFKTFHETREYKYELKLDLVNFFPSVDPLIVYEILIENIPVTFNDPEDIGVFKTIVYKLLLCKVTNLESDLAIKNYYGKSGDNFMYTKGIAQGLPQSYFFGNICMIKIADIFDEFWGGKALYYVDDSYIYTNKKIENEDEFKKQLEMLNDEIREITQNYINLALVDSCVSGKLCWKGFRETLNKAEESAYGIKVHTNGKSTYTDIQESKEGEIYLRTLSREASQIGTDIFSTYSEDEDETMLHRTQILLNTIEKEIDINKKENEGYAKKLERYYKFFKYREIKLRLRTEKNLPSEMFKVLLGDTEIDNTQEIYFLLKECRIDTEKFFNNFKHDIWQVAMSLLIANTVDEHADIREYIRDIIDKAYPAGMLSCSYINRMYKDYIDNKEMYLQPNSYATLERQTNIKLIRYANMNSKILKDSFEGVWLKELKEDILTSFGICSEKFTKTSIIVNRNTNRLQRMFLNAVYSKMFKVSLSEDVVLNSYDKKGISYGELRTLVYLRNINCDINEFIRWKMDIMGPENSQIADYTIFEVIGAYKKYVIASEYIDNLIMVHKYTCDVWKNGAKHLYFYTLHNQEHAVDLAKNIIKIIKVISYLRISNYDYYILFIACYLHDISMVRIASESDFLLDRDESEKIVTEIESDWISQKSAGDIKNIIIKTYKSVDSFFEKKIRSRHGEDSGEEIRSRDELEFLDPSIRESVADIAESHMKDIKDIYYSRGDAKNRLISYKFDKILLRFADLLDMSEHRVSKPILNHNIDNMSEISAFHWVSHLMTEGYSLVSRYDISDDENVKSNLIPGRITETVILSIYVNLAQFSKMKCANCSFGVIDEKTLSDKGFTIEMIGDGKTCSSEKCNFLCRWFNKKNEYLVQEMQALEAYLSRVPVTERFYNTKIKIKVVIQNPMDISDEQFEILKKNI